jgi:porin
MPALMSGQLPSGLFRSPFLMTTLWATLLMSLGGGIAWGEEAASTLAASPTEWEANSRSAGNRPGGPSALGSMLREGPTGGIWQRSQLLGDLGGVRSWLGRLGISLNFQETSEVLGNVTGGYKKGAYYDGLTTMSLQMDTKRAFGLYGGLFNISALQVHGLNLSIRNLGTLQTASGIEADDGIRLWELWYQQSFFFNQVDVKVGNQSLDQEFIVSQYAGLFVNTMFGWPMLTSADLLSGGPAYPLASPGARLRVQPSGEPWAFLAGVFDDNPAGVDPQAYPLPDPQQLNAHGTNFRLKDKPLVIAEIQYSQPAIGQLEYADRAPILPGTYKLGFWYDFGQYPDQEYGTDGVSLADTANSNSTPALHQGNYSIYGVIDQLVWRESAESAEGVGVFLRAMGGPGVQNLINFSMNAGLNWHAPFRHREYDVAGLAMGRANVSGRVRGLDQDALNINGPPYQIRGSETFLELTYQYQVVPWWVLQPDLQYVFNPGAGQNPNDQTQSLGNELVLGLRTNITL